ncbi:MAG TPA: GDSL-type esterase/lipase family protein, partial [Polyangiaceae bacterium]
MTHRPSGFGSVLLALASVSFVAAQAVAAPRVPTHVACVGDSITYGYGASNQASKSYPANLQALFGASVQVKNFGRNSATMLSAPFGDLPYQDQPEYAAATSFVSGAGASALVDVIIMLGTNDSKNFNWAPSGKPKNDQQFLKDYRAMVEHFSALSPKPLIFLALPLATGNSPCCSIDGTVIAKEIVPLIKQLATEKKLTTIDINTPTTGHPD